MPFTLDGKRLLAGSIRRANASDAAETFAGTNGGAAPGTRRLSVQAAAGRHLIPVQVRAEITGTLNTNALARFRFVTAQGADRDGAEGTAAATAQGFQSGVMRATDGDILAAPAWGALGALNQRSFMSLLTDADKITSIEFYVRRSNVTDAVNWLAQILALEVG